MRLVILACLAACSTPPATRPAPVAPTPPLEPAKVSHTCADAAVGIERATKGVRAPDTTVFDEMRGRCTDDAWPLAAIDCFAMMKEGDVARCARELHDSVRDRMFGVLSGGNDRGSLAIARARLDAMTLPVAACDQFVKSVSAVLACERMPIETRIELGNDTADFWSLPEQLPADAEQRIATACGQSLSALQQHAAVAGCML
ncbi:MAG TPA: hypothetical protein VLT45_11830 [Kofleriaceae bacterium]|nr:hypothetical protein [Kofleriaceae bacterium]